jgi:hypothetical protein
MNMQNNGDKNQQMLDALMKQLGPQDKKQLESLLADKAACQKILNTPEAQNLIKQFTGGK